MEREPNTVYIASISYGKDSIAMLEAIKQLNYPLDYIISAQVWATDNIPADLPEMYEWKNYADKIIKERYGITVERCSAVVEGAIKTHEKVFYENLRKKDTTKATITDSQEKHLIGVTANLKSKPLLTYEKQFYQEVTEQRANKRANTYWNIRHRLPKNKYCGFPMVKGAWCNSKLKMSAINFSKALSTRADIKL